jgi:hypothetical protein
MRTMATFAWYERMIHDDECELTQPFHTPYSILLRDNYGGQPDHYRRYDCVRR